MLCLSIKVKVLPSPFLVNRAASISVSFAFGPYSYASTVNATVGGWPSGCTVGFTPMLFPEVLNAKQGSSMCHFSGLWYDSTRYRTQTYRVQSEHSTTGPGTRSIKVRSRLPRLTCPLRIKSVISTVGTGHLVSLYLTLII